jgi:hypothetical protein
MYKYLCKAESFDKKQRIVKLLDDNSITYRIKSAGPNIFQIAGYEKKCFWFKVYVKKADYPRALEIIGDV